MSSVNIKRLVENIRSGTNIYTPLIELVVNSIQAIDETKSLDGIVQIEILRDGQQDLVDRLADVDGFKVSDNGIGFTQQNRDSFDTLYTEQKSEDGGKGFGRFTSLKYFDQMTVKSIFDDEGKLYQRDFKLGSEKDIIIDEQISEIAEGSVGSEIEIAGIKAVKFPDKKIDTISRVIVERLLPYFVDKNQACPKITISDPNTSDVPVLLNGYLGKEASQIVEIPVNDGAFDLEEGDQKKRFTVRVFKFYYPRQARSKISLVAHRREVTETPLQTYIPEFADEFFEPDDGSGTKGRNFVIKAYVFGEHLNQNVSLERGEFRFQSEADLLSQISQTQIERKAAEIAERTLGHEIAERKERKRNRIDEYVMKQAPWHQRLSSEVDFSALPMRPSNQEIELHLQGKKFEKEISTRARVDEILNTEDATDLASKISDVIESISENSKNDLIHYVSLRKCVLDIFSKSLEIDDDGRHKSEGDVHDIIMMRKTDSNQIDYKDHNLWMLDERLNFAEYISSEKPINGGRSDRTDITIFNQRVAFRGDNAASNPITIFEFKKPQRDDFANPSSKDDPVQQIVRYVNQIRDGKFKTPQGRDIIVNDNTPFYGYVVCDLTTKVSNWLEREKQFTPMPDGLGWFQWFGNIRLYMEVISWTKLLQDAEMRNKVFFHKLGIN